MSEVTSKLFANCIAEGIKKAGESLGPGYLKTAAKCSTDFLAMKIGEKPPEINDLDQALEYAYKNMKTYLKGYTAFTYAALKAESSIQGATGSFTRMVAKIATAKAFEATGFSKALGKTNDSSDALMKYYTMLVNMGSMKREDLKVSGSNGVLNLEVDNCPYAEACIAAVAEDIPKILGGHECFRILAFATIIEVITGKQQDYKLINLTPPKCSGRIIEA